MAVGTTTTAIVTGARGFIGGAMMRRLLAEECDVVGIDRPELVSGIDRPELVSGIEGRRFRGHDLTFGLDPRALDGVELVIHGAALAGVRPSWARVHEYWRANAHATRLLRESCERAGVERIVHLSSISVYGEGEQLEETSPTRPLSPYGVFSLEAERVWDDHPGASIVRLSNVYGPGQRPDMAFATFLRAGVLGRRIRLRDGGMQLRTPTYIDDCIDGISAVVARGRAASVYNVAGPHDVRLREVPQLLSELLGRPLSLSIEPPVAGDPRTATVSSARAQRELGYRPRTVLRDGLTRQLESMHGPTLVSRARRAAGGLPTITN